MPAMDIGESQAEYLEELRAALAEAYLDEYGEMRTRDALQYLIDQHEATRGDGPLVVAEGGADDADGADAPELSVDDLPDETPPVEGDASAEAGDDAEVSETDADDGDATAADADDADANDADAGDTDSDDAGASGGGGGPSPLAQTMQLLEDNDDVWEEVDSSDGKYAVTLPDGSTEHARTKDDVRALLFKHYR